MRGFDGLTMLGYLYQLGAAEAVPARHHTSNDIASRLNIAGEKGGARL